MNSLISTPRQAGSLLPKLKAETMVLEMKSVLYPNDLAAVNQALFGGAIRIPFWGLLGFCECLLVADTELN